jgi:hypothetical protein
MIQVIGALEIDLSIGFFFILNIVEKCQCTLHKKTRAGFSARVRFENLYVMLWPLPSARYSSCYGLLRFANPRNPLI